MKELLEIDPAQDGMLWLYAPAGYLRRSHRHDELEFNFVLRGRARYLLGRRPVDLQSNTLVWLFPGQEHVLLDETVDFRAWIAVFRPGLVRRLCPPRGESAVLGTRRPEGQFHRQLAGPAAGRLAALLTELAGAVRAGDRPRFNAGLSYALLAAWAAHRSEESIALGADIHPAVARVVRLLSSGDDPAALDLPLPALAARAGLSASRLSRLFHLETGVTLTSFRNRQRLTRFWQLFGGGRRRTLMEAALEAGFGSYPQFHRVCRQLTGKSPAQWKGAPL